MLYRVLCFYSRINKINKVLIKITKEPIIPSYLKNVHPHSQAKKGLRIVLVKDCRQNALP